MAALIACTTAPDQPTATSHHPIEAPGPSPLVELHAEFAAEQVLQPADGSRIHPADGGNIGLQPLAGREAVALEHALGHLEVFGIPGHGLDRLLESRARGARRV